MKGVFLTLLSLLPALALAAAGSIGIYGEYGLWQMLVYLLACILFFPVASLLHELGHMLFGAVCGMRVKLSKTALFCPSGCAVRPLRSTAVRTRFILTALGGLILNFVFAAVGMGFLFASGGLLWISLAAPSSFYLFMINVLPLNYAAGDTDMLLAVQAIKNTAEWQVLGRVLKIQGMLAEGKNIADIEESYFYSVPQIAEYEPAFIMLVSLRADYYAAKGEEAKAQECKQRLEGLLREYAPESVTEQ